MTALLTALGSGVGARKILEYLMRKSPDLAPKIQSALASGLSAEKIIKWFSKGQNFEKLKDSMESDYSEQDNSNPLVQAQNVRRQNLGQDPASALQRNLPSIAGGIGAAVAAPYASRAAQSVLSRALPASLTGVGSQSPGGVSQAIQNIVNPNTSSMGQGPTQLPTQGMQSSVSSQPPVSPSIPNAATPPQPEVKSIDVSQIINKHGLTRQIEEISKNVKDPKGVAAILYNKFPKEMQAMQKEAGKPMEDVVAEYMGSKPGEAEKPLENPEIPVVEEKISPKVEEVEPVKIEKDSVVSSPQGIGEVKAIRNGKAIIEVDGKKLQIDESELEPTLFSEDEIADAYEDVFRKIPEAERSGFISWAGYDEDKNELGFIPRGGKYEVLHNITPEEAQMIKEGKGVARTSGERTEGLWAIGEDTRGGIISQIIHDRKKKSKAQQDKQLELPLNVEKTKKEDRGMKPVFDEMAYARNLSRAREKKKKDEERARLKKEKEDEKARKKRKK